MKALCWLIIGAFILQFDASIAKRRALNMPAQVYTVDDFGYTYIFYKGTHPDGTPLKHKTRYDTPKVVKGNNYAVDMLYIMDNSVFEHYLNQHHNHTHETWRFLIEYGSILMYEVDRMVNHQIRPYGKHIYVNPVGLYVAQTPQQSPYSVNVTLQNRDKELNAVNVLVTIHEWIQSRAKQLPPFDHAVTITRCDLTTGEGARNVQGMAWPQSICGRFSYSIVEDHGPSSTAWSIVHELAHSLGADHGGIRNHSSCEFEGTLRPPELSGGNALYTQQTKQVYASYGIRKCAIRHIEEHLSLEKHFTNCLGNTRVDWRGSLRDYMHANMRPGRRLNAHDQCRLMFNEHFRFCSDIYYARYICGRLYCEDTRNVTAGCQTRGIYQPALYGTHCAPRSTCDEYGQCVFDESIHCPVQQADALYCKLILKHRPYMCRAEKFRRYCCHACHLAS